ncbi:MAG: alpha/beta fold hydrolase [Clostridia bacterium]|nr:alpha/beta fold hydrolase [Clostridia bacterium]
MDKIRSKRKRIIIGCVICAVLLALLLACVFYLNDFYRADEDALLAYLPEHTPERLGDGSLLLVPEGATTGIIFYPGGKVENRAYLPLMSLLYERGIACVIAKMPANLAVFSPNKADKLLEELPELDSWYVGGHSLGGSMASTYASKNSDKIKGVILLASYSTTDLSDTGLEVISIYGSCDGVLNMEKYEKNRENLPNGLKEHIIEGGNHAYFGAYGEQDGDGVAQITREEQLLTTAQYIYEFVLY